MLNGSRSRRPWPAMVSTVQVIGYTFAVMVIGALVSSHNEGIAKCRAEAAVSLWDASIPSAVDADYARLQTSQATTRPKLSYTHGEPGTRRAVWSGEWGCIRVDQYSWSRVRMMTTEACDGAFVSGPEADALDDAMTTQAAWDHQADEERNNGPA